MHTGGVIFLVVVFLVIPAAIIGWIVFTRIRASRLGLPPPPLSSYIPFYRPTSASVPYGPQPAPGGIVGWVNDRIRMFKNRNNRTAAGAYEQPLAGGPGGAPTGRGAHRGFGPLDPDEAWDTRVGHEADAYGGPGGYYEEQELGLHTPRHPGGDTSYGGSSYQMNLATTPAQPGTGGYDEDRGRQRSRSPRLNPNPFADTAEPSNMSLRGVSPRPIDTAAAAAAAGTKKGKDEDSPTERRSVFRENV